MARPRDQASDLPLRCAAYTVLRRGHPRLPLLRLPAAGGSRATSAVSKCFAAARRLLAGDPDEEALSGDPDEEALFDDLDLPAALSPDLAERLNAAVAQTEAALAADGTADPLGPLFEAASGSDSRKDQGQHFTPAPVVALVLALARAGSAANVIDPTCGTGAFLTRAATDGQGARLWGCEKDPLAARLARINLRRQPGAAPGHIHTGDVLALQPGADIDGHALPRCEAVVGNLPYVRLHRQDVTRWRAVLGQSWASRDPSLVTRGPGGEPTLGLSGHADLYALLFFHLADLVAPGGRLALVTANAYLDATYGRMVERLFLRHFHVVAVVESRCEQWFADASVNTVITVVQRRGAADPPPDHRPRFVQLTRPLLPRPDSPDPADPHALAHAIESAIESAIKSANESANEGANEGANQSANEGANGVEPGADETTSRDPRDPRDPRDLRGLPYVTVDHPACRIRLVDPSHLEAALETTPQTTLQTTLQTTHEATLETTLAGQGPAEGRRQGQGQGMSDPWSAYLRAPDIYFLLRNHPALRPAGAVLKIHRGVTTNWNAFFYPPADAGVEDEYLVPVVRSPRVSRTISVRSASLKDRLFVCHASRASLRRAGHNGALAWIEGGLGMTNRQGRPINETLTGRPWYRLDPTRYRLLVTKTTHDTHLHRLTDSPTAVDQRLYGVTPEDPANTDPANTDLVAALLNSSLVALMTEVVGSASLGDGALDLPVTTARERLLMPDPAALSTAARRRILDAFFRLAGRPVLPVWREVERSDRRDLDGAVLAGLDLDVETTLPLLYEGLSTLTRERLALAAHRRTLARS